MKSLIKDTITKMKTQGNREHKNNFIYKYKTVFMII